MEVQEGDAIQIGKSEESVSLPPAFPSSGDKALATPAVRRIVSEHKIDLKSVQGTGRDGRVLKEDILAFVNSGKQESLKTPPKPPISATAPTTPKPVPVPIVPPLIRALPDR